MFLITGVQDLDINEDELEEPFMLLDGLFLGWTPSFVRTLISDQMKFAMGGLDYLELVDGTRPTLFSHGQGREWSDRPLAVISMWNHEIYRLFYGLWLIRDNSLSTDVVFMESTNTQGQPTYSSNFLHAGSVCADGVRRKVRYSRTELVEACELYRTDKQLEQGVNAPPTLGSTDEVEPRGRVVAAGAVPALVRACFFVSAARGGDDLPTKVGHYVTCLEVLFSDDSTELSHKLAERIALFLEDSFESRKKLFQTVKKLYSVRSTVVHGDTFSSPGRIRDMTNVSREADDLVRRVLRRIMADARLRALFEGSREAREEYFIDLALRP